MIMIGMLTIIIIIIGVIIMRMQVDISLDEVGRQSVNHFNRATELVIPLIDRILTEAMIGMGQVMGGIEQVRALIICHAMSMIYPYITHTPCYPQTARGE